MFPVVSPFSLDSKGQGRISGKVSSMAKEVASGCCCRKNKWIATPEVERVDFKSFESAGDRKDPSQSLLEILCLHAPMQDQVSLWIQGESFQ